jgi:hypothetical protein
MELLFQDQMSCTVRRLDSGKLQSEAVRLSTLEETVGRLVTDTEKFRIENAEWEEYRRGKSYQTILHAVPELKGVEAYFGIAPALARAFPKGELQPLRALFAECVKGIIQAETYLYTQRGYPDSSVYQDYWDRTHPGTCLYYSNLDKVDRRWFDYVGDATRTTHLFQRMKSVSVWRGTTGGLFATGSFLDSFHELGMMIECSADGKVTASTGNFLRAPGQICFENSAKADSIVGLSLKDAGKSVIGKHFGGGEGCAHMVDITSDMISALFREIHRV